MVEELRLTKEDAAEIAQRAYADPVFFMKFFLSHKFPKDIPWVHRGLLAILTKKTSFLWNYGEIDKIISNFLYKEDPLDPNSKLLPIFQVADGKIKLVAKKFTEIMLPRGASKTTLAGQGVILYWICYRDRKFPVYVSETQTHAEMQVGNIARELEGNARLRAVFGNLVPERQESLKWTQEVIQTTNGVTVVARGRGTQVRGLLIGASRPDIILLDDVEDRDSVKTAEQRQKTKTWAYGDVLPALPEMDDEATIVALGTLLHQEALLMTWKNDPDWTSIVFGVRDLQGAPLWADYMTEEKIEKKKSMYARAGQLSQYYLEYENAIRNESTAKFKQENFIYEPITRDKLVGVAMALDPAISDNPTACEATIYVAGMSESGLVYVLDHWAKVGATGDEQIEKFFELAFLHDVTLYGIEAVQFQASLIHTCTQWMFRKRRYFEVKPLRHSQKKEERIEGILQPHYISGYMRHTKRFVKLEEQLLDWPNGMKDHPDALAMAMSLLDIHAPSAANHDKGKDLGDDEYEPLEMLYANKRGQPQDWRVH